jgi:threonine/homoserine/homoserine lactone efflux protein
VSGLDHVGPAFGLGFALGAAPGPVQLLILSETSRRGLSGGLRVMLGANGTLVVVMAALAVGFSSLQPGLAGVRALRVAGGAFLVYLGAAEILALRRRSDAETRTERGPTLGPTARGVLSVALSPGAWVFFATTDLSFALLGSGGSRLLRDRGLVILRATLAAALIVIGIAFVWLGAL